MRILKIAFLAIMVSIACFFLFSYAFIRISNSSTPVEIPKDSWNFDENFYISRKPVFVGGDYVFFYVSEFGDNPKTYCILGKRMSTSSRINGVNTVNNKIDEQTFMSGLVFWSYDGKNVEKRTAQAINYVGDNSLLIKGNDSDFLLEGTYPNYSFEYTDKELSIQAKILEQDLGNQKTRIAHLNNTHQELIEEGGSIIIRMTNDKEFMFYNTTMRLIDAGERGYTVVQFSGGDYLNALIQDLWVGVETSINNDSFEGVLYMESVHARGGLPATWILLSSWFKDGSHFWFAYYPDMVPFTPTFDRNTYIWFYDSETRDLLVFNKFSWKETKENGTTRFYLEVENTESNARAEIVARLVANATTVIRKDMFPLHKHDYIQIISAIEEFNLYSPAYNKSLEEMGPTAGYAEKSILTGYPLKKEYSNY